MKKLISFVAVIVICFCLMTVSAFAENKYMGNEGTIEILEDYTFTDSLGWYTYHYMVIKNTSDNTLKVSTSSIAYDANNAILGTDSSSEDAIGPGCTSIIYDAFNVDGTVDHIDTVFSTKKESYYESVIQDLSYEIVELDKGAVIFVTNNGEYVAEFPEGYALFIKDGKVVSHDSVYFTDHNSELLPGKTIFKQVDTSKEYDSIEFFLTGRRSSSAKPYEGTAETDCAVEILKDDFYTDSLGWYTYHFMVIQNNSDSDVTVDVAELVYDKNNTLLGADDADFDVLGPGCVSVVYTAFNVSGSPDHFETNISTYPSSYYRSVVENVTYTQSDIAKGAVIFATNNGEFDADFVQGIVLFYNNGKIVAHDTTYFTDDDSELKAGSTIFKQIDTYATFDALEVYFTGRAPK